jgi:hypothetical protein
VFESFIGDLIATGKIQASTFRQVLESIVSDFVATGKIQTSAIGQVF